MSSEPTAQRGNLRPLARCQAVGADSKESISRTDKTGRPYTGGCYFVGTSPTGAQVARWLELGQGFDVLGWQRSFLRGFFENGVELGAVTVGRGNGKSTLAAELATACLIPGSPLHRDGSTCVVVSASMAQGESVFGLVVERLKRLVPEFDKEYSKTESFPDTA